MRVGDGRRIDARSGLELPQRLAGPLVEGDHLAGQLAREHQPAAGHQHPCGAGHVGQRDLPLLLSGQRIDRHQVADHIARLEHRNPAEDAGRVRAEDLWFRRSEFLDSRHIPATGINESRVRVECNRHGIGAALRPDLDLFPSEKALVQVRQHRASRRKIDVRRPVHLGVGARRDQRAIGAIQHIEETVLVRLDHDLPHPAADLHIGEHGLVSAVHVVHVVGRVLKMTDEFTRDRPDRDHARRVQAIKRSARPRIVGLRIARAPVDEVELWVIRTRAPGRAAALLPGVAVLRPGLVARLARRRDGVATPQFLPGLRIPAIEEATSGELAAGHPGNHDAIGHNRCAGGGVALVPVGKFLVPQHLAALHVEGEQMVVDRDAKQPPVVDRRGASVDRAKEGDARGGGVGVHRSAPDLTARLHVYGEGPLAIDDVHDAVVDGRRRQLACVIHQARVPDRHEALHVGPVDLYERAVVLPVVAHALGRHVRSILAVVDELFRRLGQTLPRQDTP